MKRFVAVLSSRDLILKWAEVMVMVRSVRRRIEVADAWIAATALLYDSRLVTNNGGDYLGVAGLKIVVADSTGQSPDN